MLSPSFLLKKTNIKTGKQLLFYMTALIWVLSYTLLAFNISLLLSEKLSVFYVGLFMGITHFLAIFADIPLGYLQKIIPSRWILFFSTLGLIFTTFVFLGGQTAIYLAFAAVLVYGLAHDMYDITMLSYIFQNSHPEGYSQDISQKNVAEALGLLIGLTISGGLNLIAPLFSPLWIILLFLIVTAVFIVLFFNKTEYEVEWTQLDANIMAEKFSPEELLKNFKEFAISAKNIAVEKLEDVKNAIREKFDKGHVVVLKPIRPLQKYEPESFSKELKESFQGVGSIFVPPKGPLIWSSIIVAFFSFWDTFVVTFQPVFIAKKVIGPSGLHPAYGSIVIALFIIPLFVCQVPFAKFADKIGRPFFMYLGLIISGLSIAAFSLSTDIFWTILMGLFNSLGYAAAMPAGQAFFAQRFQENYAVLHNTRTIDANVSAGPLKILLNLGNVFGTLIGGVLISLFDFQISFIVLGGFLIFVFLISMIGMAWVIKPILKPAANVATAPETNRL